MTDFKVPFVTLKIHIEHSIGFLPFVLRELGIRKIETEKEEKGRQR